MENNTAHHSNSVNSSALRCFNRWGGVSFDDILSSYPSELVDKCWYILSRMIIENFQMGKGTFIKGFGTFTFTNIEYSLEGTTNQYERDIKKRRPLFLVSSEFVDYLKQGIYTKKSGLIYYTQKMNNNISIVKVNYALMSYGINLSKEECYNIITNTIRKIGDEIRRGIFKSKIMPNLGTLIIKKNIIGVKFENGIIENSMCKSQQLYHIKKNLAMFMETSHSDGIRIRNINNIDKAERNIRPNYAVVTHISQSGDEWMRKSVDIDVKQIKDEIREDLKINKPKFGREFQVDQRYYRNYPVQKLKGLDVPQDILEAIARENLLIIREMKKYDRHGDGFISHFEFINAFAKANVSYKLRRELITEILHLYVNDPLQEINYKMLVNEIVKDINDIIKNEYTYFPIDRYKNKINKMNKRAISALNFSKSEGNFSPEAISTQNNFRLQIKPYEDDVKEDITKLKSIIRFLDKDLSKQISFIELISKIEKLGITMPKVQILKILKFLGIVNPNSFLFGDFIHKLQKTSFIKPNYDVKQWEITNGITEIKNVLFDLGGKDYLFKEKENITFNEFSQMLLSHVKMTPKVFKAVYEYITKKAKEMTYEMYNEYCLNDKEIESKDKTFDIQSIKKICDKMVLLDSKSNSLFEKLLSYNNLRRENTLTLQEFENAMQLEQFDFSKEEINKVFEYIDYKKDGYIDREEWNKTINSIAHPIIQIQNYIRNKKLSIEMIAYKMGIDLFIKDINKVMNEPIDKQKFKLMMKQMDENFKNEFIFILFDSISNNSPYITPSIIFKYFNIFKKEEYKSINSRELYAKVTSIFIENLKMKNLIKEFQRYDPQITHKISISNFLKVLHEKIGNKLTDEEVLRFIRMNRKFDRNDNIYYREVCRILFANAKEDEFLQCIQFLKKFLKEECNNDLYIFFGKMNNLENNIYPKERYISHDKLYEFFLNQVEYLQRQTIDNFDIDKDGKISFDDLKGVILKYISKEFFDNKAQIAKDKEEYNRLLDYNKRKKFVNLLRIAIKDVNMTENNLFTFLDADKDGFISREEFTSQIIQFQFKEPITNEQINDFYSFLDVFNNQKVDISIFQQKLSLFKIENTYKGNFTFENLILSELAMFYMNNVQLCDTEFFSLLDRDQDGIISLNDLKDFAETKLLLNKGELNDKKIQHVMYAIASKNDNITLVDIQKLMKEIENDHLDIYFAKIRQLCNIGVSTNNKDQQWLNQIIERMGMFINEKHGTIEQLYNHLGNKPLDINKFKIFIDNNIQIVRGYNFGIDELNALFNYISDNSREITLLHLKKHFGNNKFSYYTKMHNDILTFIRDNFPTAEDAFKYFHNVKPKENIPPTEDKNALNESINLDSFYNGINSLFPNKYQTDTITNYIAKYFPKLIEPGYMSFSEFTFVYFNTISFNRTFSSRYNIVSKINTSRPKSVPSKIPFNSPFEVKNHTMLKTPFDIDPLDKIKRLIHSSPIDYKSMITKTIQGSGNGYINKFEFRNLIKKFNLGLTNLEIEDIIAHAGINFYTYNYINLYDFYKYLTSENNYLKIAKENVLNTLKEIKQLIYKYYTNPKMAFNLNDKDISTQMDFEKFKKIVFDLFNRDKKKLPNYPMLKCIYDTIDIRKDGVIDLNEWNKVLGTTEGKNDSKIEKSKQHNLRQWETSNDISTIFQMIARNRKAIKERVKYISFRDMKKVNGMVILGENLITILKDLFKNLRLTNSQWKMIISLGERDRSGLIDVDLFLSVILVNSRVERSHPIMRFK